MMISTDDDLKRIDKIYLGPRKFRFYWYWPYRVYFMIVFIAPIFAALFIWMAVPINLFTGVLWGALSIALARVIDRKLRPGVGLGQGLQVIAQEIASPRRDAFKPERHEIRTTVQLHKGDT